MSYRTKTRVAACAAIAALLSSFPSVAQEAPAGASDDSEGLEDVIITAQRREESVQNASLSIEAIGMEELAQRGVNDALNLNDVVPGLKIATTGGQLQVFIRGVGDVSANAYTQASVSLNVDGVYIARGSAFSSTFFDTARIEVLRGPQGTLYGRNSSGGAINVISAAPELGESNGYLVAEAGNFGLHRAQGAYGTALSDTFAIRVAGQIVRRDGFLSDGSNDDRSEALRLRTLWAPNDDLSIGLTAEVAKVGGNGPGRVYRPALFGDPWTGPQDPRITPALFPALRVRNDNSIDTDSLALTGEVNWALGDTNLTVIPAYRKLEIRSNIGVDLIFDETDDSEQTSLEARLSRDTERLNWVVGAFVFAEDLSVFVRNDQRVAATRSGALQFQDIGQFDTEAWAVFGESRFSLSDELRLITGVRYTEETRERTGLLTNLTYTNGNVTNTRLLPLLNSAKVDATTWRAGFEYDVAERSMAYATVSKGFKSGGFDATGIDPYDPEYVTAYTLGLKNRLFDNTLQLNLEAFYWKYKDQQIGFLGIDSTGTTSFITRNAGQSKIRGGNIDIIWRPTAADKFDLGFEYLDTNYSDFRYNAVGAVTPAGTLLADGCLSDGPVPGVTGQFIQNCSNQPLPRAPELSGNLRYSHEFTLANGGSVVAAGVLKYQSRSYLGLNYRSPNFRQEAFETTDLDLTYNAPEGKWSLQAYVRNVSDEPVYLTASTQASIAPTTGVNRGSVDAIGPPRTFGARFQINF